MAVTSRTKLPAAGLTSEPVAGPGDLEDVVRVLARMTCALAVNATRGRAPATFRQIAVQELRIASHADVDLIEKFLQGG